MFRDSFSLLRESGAQSRAKDETSLSQLRCSRPLLNTDLEDSLEGVRHHAHVRTVEISHREVSIANGLNDKFPQKITKLFGFRLFV